MATSRDLLRDIPVTDDHVHFRPGGRLEEAVEGFLRHGGRRIVLVHAPYDERPAVSEGFEAAYQVTLDLAERARALGVEVHVALGPHPVELLALEEAQGLPAAVAAMRAGLEAAARHVEEGEAVALGEIGRPHFPVGEAQWRASNELMAYGMELARDAGCPVVLHTEEATPEVYGELAALAAEAGLPPERVVKHHAGPLVLPAETHGIFPSVVAKGGYLEEASRKGLRFLMETDYLDDPRRPGAVLGLSTVPRRCARLLAEGILPRAALLRIHEENVRAVYGV